MLIALVLALLVLSLVMFSFEIVSIDLIALSALLVLIACGALSPEQAFASFGSEMIILLASIFVIAGALQRTGVLDSIGLLLYRHCSGSYRRLLVSIVLVVAVVSAFMNNTVVTAVFVPIVLAVARRAHLSPSQLLMPVAFAAMLGGCCTLVGTSTNIAASAFLTQRGLEPFRLFEFLPVGLAAIIAGTVFFALLGPRLLPVRAAEELTRQYKVKEYLTEFALRSGCPFIGKRLEEGGLRQIADVTVLGIIRGGSTRLAPQAEEVLQEADVLLIKGEVEGIQKLRQTPGVESKVDVSLGDSSLESENIRLVEVMVGPGSRFLGRTLKEIDFRHRFGLTAMALHRLGEDVIQRVGKIVLKVGDVLLVQGPEGRLDGLHATGNVLVLSDLSHFLLDRRKGIYVVSFFVGSLLLGGIGAVPLGPAVLAAAVLTVLARAVTSDEAYRMVDWRLLMLIGGMTSFGRAMVNSGADKFLADLMIKATGYFGIYGLLAGFLALTVALTQPLSNAAAALAVLPIAIATAEKMGANPRTFAVMVTMAASLSFITPMEPSCVLVYPSGRYRFADFIKVGGALTLVIGTLLLILIPLIWPLR
ncbi:MAG TPA: SLC13 family permease [Acidobacteriota bacterium]|nr:SLC13 family permease [Acidobacteriota bacterium]